MVLEYLHLCLQFLHPFGQLGTDKGVLLGNASDFIAEVSDVTVDGLDLGLDLHLDVLEDQQHFILHDFTDELLLLEQCRSSR